MSVSVIPHHLGKQISLRIAYLRDKAGDYTLIEELLADLDREQDPATALQNIHRLQRIYFAAKLGLLDEPKIYKAIDAKDFPLWKQYTALPVADEYRVALAKLMYEGDKERRSPIFITLPDYSRGVAELIVEQCVVHGDEIDIFISDPLFQRRLMHHCDQDKAEMLASVMMAPYDHYQRSIAMRIEQVQQPYPDEPVAQEIQKIYNDTLNAQYQRTRGRFYTLAVLPTPKDAELDQIPYPDYIDLFFRMCAVDWDKVDAAHKILIAQLNQAKTLRFTNNDGTDFTVNIEGFTFCNSLVAKNVPGSEVFSAPHRDSATGLIVGKGRYMYMGKVMENITLRFEEGRVVDYAAEKGQEILKELLDTDEGSRYVGEIAIGTNPVLRQHLVNGLLTEKIGGSFHFALGRCYNFTDYLGIPVKVDNGNKSANHEDMTIMLHGKQGRIYIDGDMIMDDGKFIDPRLGYLNGDA